MYHMIYHKHRPIQFFLQCVKYTQNRERKTTKECTAVQD